MISWLHRQLNTKKILLVTSELSSLLIPKFLKSAHCLFAHFMLTKQHKYMGWEGGEGRNSSF